MIAILGWVLFAVTIVVSICRDVYQQLLAEKRYDDALRYWEGKQKEWLEEKRNLDLRSLKLVSRLSKVERAMRDV